MLDPGYVRDHQAEVEARLLTRGPAAVEGLAELQALEAERRQRIQVVENLKRDQNTAS